MTDAQIRELAHQHLRGRGDGDILNFARAVIAGSQSDLVKALQRALDDLEDTAHIIDMKATKDAVCRSIAIKANAVRATLIKVGAA